MHLRTGLLLCEIHHGYKDWAIVGFYQSWICDDKQIPTWLKNYSWLRIHILTSIRSQLTRRSPKLKSLNENILANTFTSRTSGTFHLHQFSTFYNCYCWIFWGFIAMFKGIAPPSLSISGHLKEIMRMKSWLTCWKEQVDTVNCLSNIWIKKSRSVGTNCCGVSALVLQLWLLSRFSCLAQMLDPDSYYQNGHELMKEKLITSSLALQDKGLQSQMPSLSLRQHSMFVLID